MANHQDISNFNKGLTMKKLFSFLAFIALGIVLGLMFATALLGV